MNTTASEPGGETARPDVAREAAEASTPAGRQFEIASAHPDLLPVLASNPGLYPQLRQWLESLGDPDVDEGLALGEARRAAGGEPSRVSVLPRTSMGPPQRRAIVRHAATPAAEGSEMMPPVSTARGSSALTPSAAPRRPPRRGRLVGIFAAVGMVVAGGAVVLALALEDTAPRAATSPADPATPADPTDLEDTHSGAGQRLATPPAMTMARAEEELDALRTQSLEGLDLDGRWVLQLASKRDGEVDPYTFTERGSHTFYVTDILAEHEAISDRLTASGARVLLLNRSDFGEQTLREGTYWVTLADLPRPADQADAEEACALLFPHLTGKQLQNSCWPRQLTPPSG